ncbi:MAG: YdjY domain-containing protein [Limisphaerales bacterium]
MASFGLIVIAPPGFTQSGVAPREPASTLGAPPSLLIPNSATNLPVKSLGEGRWQLGEVLIDKNDRSVTFPAVVNMNSSVVEYFAVATGGKTHESVLRTDARPFDIHVGMLLLGAKGATSADPAVFFDPKQKTPGDEIDVLLRYDDEGRSVIHPAASWIHNAETKTTMTAGPWAYNGSQVIEGGFVAQREGSIVSLISDPYALVNNPRQGHENDEIWRVNTNAVPALNTRVDVTLRLK